MFRVPNPNKNVLADGRQGDEKVRSSRESKVHDARMRKSTECVALQFGFLIHLEQSPEVCSAFGCLIEARSLVFDAFASSKFLAEHGIVW